MILIGPILMFGGLLLVCWLGTPDERELQELRARDERFDDEYEHQEREREHADDDWTRGPAPRAPAVGTLAE